MAQDFERNIARNVGTSEVAMRTANSDDAIVGINIANVTTSQILMDVYITGAGGTRAGALLIESMEACLALASIGSISRACSETRKIFDRCM